MRQPSSDAPPSHAHISASPSPLQTGMPAAPPHAALGAPAPTLFPFANSHQVAAARLTGGLRFCCVFLSSVTRAHRDEAIPDGTTKAGPCAALSTLVETLPDRTRSSAP